MGKTDKIIRVVLGIVLIVIGWGLLQNNWLGIILNVVAALLLLSAITGKFPLIKEGGKAQQVVRTNEPPPSPQQQPNAAPAAPAQENTTASPEPEAPKEEEVKTPPPAESGTDNGVKTMPGA